MNILITGSSGMLGTDLVEELSHDNNYNLITPSSSELDITNLNNVLKYVSVYTPDLIINSAAYTDVDGAENDYDNAYKVNSLGPRNLAIASNEFDCKLVHISTDYVFNGMGESPYKECDKTDPLGVYGKTKFYGEQYIRNLSNKFYILRTSWLYGKNGSNFVETMLDLSKKYNEISVVNDQVGSPTYTKDLALAIHKLTKTPLYGVYHITNSGECSWYEFSKKIFDYSNIDIKVNPVPTEDFPTTASRPKYSVLDNYNWKLEFSKPLRHYKEALKDYLH